ncbi:MAG TPA: histidine phosphatase family protein, partial [Planctomycetota bacterium]|nr:histidine phosphatase family protein [Planctomycetota bacterium]
MPLSGRPPFATLVCLRHGDLEPRYALAAVGRTDAALDPAAAEREAKAVETLARFRPAKVLSSDRRRCEGTAARVAALADCPHAARRDLRERDFGRWDGREWPALVAEDPRGAAAFLNAF